MDVLKIYYTWRFTPVKEENAALCGGQLSAEVTILNKSHSTKLYYCNFYFDDVLFQYILSFWRNT